MKKLLSLIVLTGIALSTFAGTTNIVTILETNYPTTNSPSHVGIRGIPCIEFKFVVKATNIYEVQTTTNNPPTNWKNRLGANQYITNSVGLCITSHALSQTNTEYFRILEITK